MTKSGPNDGNPVLDLREILGDEDEPLGPADVIPPTPTAVAPVAKAPPAASPGPPPLPTKRGSAARPASGTQGVGAPGLSIPPPVGRPSGDPFQEPVEPRLPRGLPEEKVEFFRTVLKQKQETIARARAIYAEREQEADQIREAVQALNARLEAALAELERLREFPNRLQEVTQQYQAAKDQARKTESRAEQVEAQVAALEADFQAVVEERKALSKALAEVEVQIPELTGKLDQERKAGAASAAELVEVQKSFQVAEEQVSELLAKKSELEGDLEAVNEQYQSMSSENERLTSELEHAAEELRIAVAERDAALAEQAASRGDLDPLKARIRELEQEGTAAGARAQEQARRLVNEVQEKARHSIQEAQEQARRQALEAEEKARRSLHEVQSRAGAAAEQLQDLKAQVSRLQAEKAQAKAQGDQQLKKLKEELTSSTQRKIGELQTRLAGEEEKRTELQIRLAESEGKSEALASQLASLETQLGSARQDQSGARKARDELTSTQQRAVELQGLLQKERREKDAVEKRALAAEGGKTQLEARIAALESALARVKAEPERAKTSGSAGQAELVAERDKLKLDLASMKKKLVAAEAAMEAAASLKAKVTRLEAQLKGKK